MYTSIPLPLLLPLSLSLLLLLHLPCPVVSEVTPFQTVMDYFLNRPVSWEMDHDNLCEVNGRAFTGMRILGEHKLVEHEHRKLVLTECRNGLSISHAVLHANESLWNHPIELNDPEASKSKTFELRNRDIYKSEQLRYIPGTIVGGIFTVQDFTTLQSNAIVPNNTSIQNTTKQSIPYSPLVADSWSHCYTNLRLNGGLELELLDPLLRSPDQLDKFYPLSASWADEMFPNSVISDN